jgi:hypothetical protein
MIALWNVAANGHLSRQIAWEVPSHTVLSQYTECISSSRSNIRITVLEKFDDLRNSIHG